MIDNSEINAKMSYSDRLSFTLDAIVNWRKFIFICAIISILISLLVALILPVQYKSTASVLPTFGLYGSIEIFIVGSVFGVITPTHELFAYLLMLVALSVTLNRIHKLSK